MIRPRRLVSLTVGGALITAMLAGCAGTVSMQPADAADDPVCAAVSVRLPRTLDGLDRRWTDAQATGAWGSPASILLTCGVPEPGPTTLRCEEVEGVDWVIDESRADENLYTLTTFGTSPAVQIFIDRDVVDSGVATRTLSPILRPELEPNGRECTARPGTEESS